MQLAPTFGQVLWALTGVQKTPGWPANRNCSRSHTLREDRLQVYATEMPGGDQSGFEIGVEWSSVHYDSWL